MKEIGRHAFDNCTGLKSVTIPANVSRAEEMAFAYCSSLKEIRFQNQAPEVGGNAFYRVTAKAYYPREYASWTQAVRQNYGGKAMTVKATPLTVDGKTPTVKTLAWTSSKPEAATVANGKVTAKTVYVNTPVTITVQATDGSGVSASFTVIVKPKADLGLVLRNGGEIVNGKTVTVSLSELKALDLSAMLYSATEGSESKADVTWKSANAKVARVDENGHIELLKTGTVKITVTSGKLTATVTLKIVK